MKTKYSLTLTIALLGFINFKGHSSVKKLRNNITNLNNKIHLLITEIKDLDKRISEKNETYVQQMKEMENIDEKVEDYKISLKKSASQISKEYELTKIALNNYLMEVGDSNKRDNLMEKKVYLELLEKKVSDLEKAQEESKNQLASLQSLENTLKNRKMEEGNLYKLIIDLENRKKEVSQKYIDLMEDKNVKQEKLDKIIVKIKAKRKIQKKSKNGKAPLFKLSLPLESYSEIKNSKLGVSLVYSETLPISAPYPGKVVYSGELASYGNVLILDHGKEVRSVLLGDIVPKVKKGDIVSKKQLIGYTISDLGTTKSLYFEVRKKDIAQNTSSWIENTTEIKKI